MLVGGPNLDEQLTTNYLSINRY
uniref:Uncharacterized protein n=1 Tax=Anguilla anguilla TaxID=7936 RepID=A0A0E9QN42_ANGAN